MTDRIAELRELLDAERKADQLRGSGKRREFDAWMRAHTQSKVAVHANAAALLDCAEALQGLVAYAKESQGIAGYHLSGAILEWDDVEELHAGMNALAKLNGDSNEG